MPMYGVVQKMEQTHVKFNIYTPVPRALAKLTLKQYPAMIQEYVKEA